MKSIYFILTCKFDFVRIALMCLNKINVFSLLNKTEGSRSPTAFFKVLS